jgi:hypothetical protein
MAGCGLLQVTANPVERPGLVESLGLAASVTDGAVDVQRFLLGAGRGRIVPG